MFCACLTIGGTVASGCSDYAAAQAEKYGIERIARELASELVQHPEYNVVDQDFDAEGFGAHLTIIRAPHSVSSLPRSVRRDIQQYVDACVFHFQRMRDNADEVDEQTYDVTEYVHAIIVSDNTTNDEPDDNDDDDSGDDSDTSVTAVASPSRKRRRQ